MAKIKTQREVSIIQDITKIKINPKIPKQMRIEKFIRDVGNPYSYMCGEYRVNIEFKDNSPSLQNKMENLVLNGNNFS